MTAWTADVEAALAATRTPQEKVATYVRVSLELIKDGSHGLLVLLSAETLPTHVRRQLSELHATLAAPLNSAVAELGVPDVDLATRYVQGVVEAAARRVAPGQDIDEETAAATSFVIAVLRALADAR